MKGIWILWVLFGISDSLALGLIGNYFWPSLRTPRAKRNRSYYIGQGTALAFYAVSFWTLFAAVTLLIWPVAQVPTYPAYARLIVRGISASVIWWVYIKRIRTRS